MRTVREVSGTSWPTLTRTNYGEWAVTMKVKLRARRLWNAIDKGTDNEEDDISALKAIFVAMPVEYREPLETKNSAKETWEAITAMRIGSDRAKKVTAQLLKQEYANLKFKDGETVVDFTPPPTDAHQQAGEPWHHHRRRGGDLQVPPLRAGKVHPDRSLHRDDAGLVHPHN